MALSPPSMDELATFMGVSESDLDERAEAMLQMATDLMSLASAATVWPEGACGRLMTQGILDMAWKLMVDLDHREETFGPYSSERIGSYSYSKMGQQVASSLTAGEPSGVPFFDAAVRCASGVGNTVSLSSERVFNPDAMTYAESQELDNLGFGVHAVEG